MFIKNEEINKFLDARGKVVLNACPGSGKTTSIAYKLQTLTEEIVKNNNKYSGVACLSFTNIAKDEINQRYKTFAGYYLKYPHLVSTIDSFINQYIVLPNYHLLFPHINRPSILNNSIILDSFNLWDLNRKYKINKIPISKIYKPSDIKYSLGKGYVFKKNKPAKLDKSQLIVFNNYCNQSG